MELIESKKNKEYKGEIYRRVKARAISEKK